MIRLRPAHADDFDFLWELHRAGLKPYVDAIWGWDEAGQQRRFQTHFDPAAIEIIQFEGQDVGSLSVETRPDSLFLAYIALVPSVQGCGLGTVVIQQVIKEAEQQGLPVTLQVLRGNPAQRLYERLGFVVTSETDTHRHMRRPLPTSPEAA